jgi:molecular chaperone HtpG
LLTRGKEANTRRVLEVNVKHPIIVGMNERQKANTADPLLEASADLLLGAALVAERSELTDPVAFNARIAELLEQALRLPSS